MKRVCAWCGEVMDPGDPADPRVTHGICERCRVGARAEIHALFATGGQEESPPLIDRWLKRFVPYYLVFLAGLFSGYFWCMAAFELF